MILRQRCCDDDDHNNNNFVTVAIATTMKNIHHHALLVNNKRSYGMETKNSCHNIRRPPVRLRQQQQQRTQLRFGHWKRYKQPYFSTARTSMAFLINILLLIGTSWTATLLDMYATNPIQTWTTFCATTTTTTKIQPLPVVVFAAAWMTSTSIHPKVKVATNKYTSMTNTKRFITFATKSYHTNQLCMTTNSNDNDIDFYTINYNNPLRNTTLPKKSSVVRPAFGQVKHRPTKLQSYVKPTPSTPTSTNTKLTLVPTVPQPHPRQQFQLSSRNKKMNSDGSITSLHTSRIQNAGRVGTKRYINPCKVYFGNLSFQITDKSILQNFVIQQMGLPKHILLKECNIVTDWKTNQSKGYGFVIFTEPIYATIAITKLHGTSWYNRTITVNQGVHKQNMEELQAIYQNAYRKQQLRLEEEQLNNNKQQTTRDDEIIYMDAKEAALLKHLDPDLLDGVQIITNTVNDNDKQKKKKNEPKGKQSKITMEVDEDDDDDYDIDYDDEIEYDYDDDEMFVDDIDVEMDENYDIESGDDDDDILSDDLNMDYDNRDVEVSSSTNADENEEAATTKNRQQRRDDAKSKKKIKLPRKGFG